ncbi:hypothetical protein [Metabacillus niabensis]|uniref:hypothetical protein n=1 Tax=Metabacillus niabensis TaxID=324854 RepID=UPI001CFBAC5B|nr:hypothetical protein [Metabacillus niabensis]
MFKTYTNIYFNAPLTITVSTVTGQAFVQLDRYIATDNVVICTAKQHLRPTTLFYIATALNSEKWRWMYGRQCYKKKFAKTIIPLPTKKDKIDEDTIENIVKSTWGWEMIESNINKNIRKLIHMS